MTSFKRTILAVVCSVASLSSPTSMVSAFSMPMFTEQKTMQRTTPSKTDGVEIEIPNFDELFGRIKEVSPLAALAFDGKEGNFQVADELRKYTYSLSNFCCLQEIHA